MWYTLAQLRATTGTIADITTESALADYIRCSIGMSGLSYLS